MERWKTSLYLLLILLCCIISIVIFYDFKNHKFNIKLGLDLRSGSHIVVQLKPVLDPRTNKFQTIDESLISQTKRVFERRLNPQGVKEILIQSEMGNRIIIEIPEETDVKKAEDMIKKTARLEFKEQFYNTVTKKADWRTVMDGRYLKKASATYDPSGLPEVQFELDKEGAKQFAEITERNVGKPLGIFFDKEQIDAPSVKEVISGGSGRISGGKMTLEDCQRLATYLNSGSLPVDVEIIESMTVSPTLGKESLMMSLMAGFIGLMLVILFMIWYYRLPGVLADVALICYTLFVLASMTLKGFVLTLPGIAGIILSIGMAVDANVLIFERLKEELWSEKSLRNSVDIGFRRAFSSILDSHVTTFIGAAILYWLGSSSIKGFGLTLMIGTVWSILTAVFVTRVFVDVLLEGGFAVNRKLYGE